MRLKLSDNFFMIAVCVLLNTTMHAQNMLVAPYIQPGNAPSLTKEQKVIIWQTDSVAGNFTIDFSLVPDGKVLKSKVSCTKLVLKNNTTNLYRATLTGLKFDAKYKYRVMLNGKAIAESTFETRTKKNSVKFAVFGDCGAGTPQQAEVAYQVQTKNPQFVLVTGDNVYRSGLASEYRKNFFPYYLSAEPSATSGAALMNRIPFYMIVGNHDVYGAEFDKYPDGLAYFYYNDLPLNGPTTDQTVKATGPEALIKAFRKNTGNRFPRMTNFSFDYGNVHITCLDANPYVNPLDPTIVQWLSNDINTSKATWKIVAFHHPGFNSSKAHYNYQQMRLLSPILEQLGVDMVLNGHVHNYQRTVPLTFDPKKDSTGTQYVVSSEGRVDGTFTLDENFDGASNSKPKGIVYVVTGAGGAPLYDTSLSGKPDLWKHDPQTNWVPFTKKIVSDTHSFTMIEVVNDELTLIQYTSKGEELDRIRITKK
jgi:hypothetical protein